MDTRAPAGMGENPSPSQWFVIRTQPQAESVAARELGRDGLRAFFPKVATVHAQGGRSEGTRFPGYLFLQCWPEIARRFAFRPGHRVAGWVNLSRLIPSVPDRVIAELMLRVAQTNRDGGLWRRSKPVKTVNVVARNVETLAEGVSGAKSPRGRVKVLLNFMGGMVEAKVSGQRRSGQARAPLPRLSGSRVELASGGDGSEDSDLGQPAASSP